MPQPLVSVVIPVYNAEKYLARCIDSVLDQDYPYVEILLVNDGSTDRSKSICEKYSNIHHNIRLINQTNQGASLARKAGIAKARGEYLMFIDSDDYVSTKYVSGLLDALKQSGGTVAVCPMKRLLANEMTDSISGLSFRSMTADELFKRFFRYEFWGFWGGIYHREVFDSVIFPKATVNEDYFVKAQIFSTGKKVGYVEEPLYYYEVHPGSLSNQPLSLRALEEFDNAFATWKYMRDNLPGYSDHALAIASEVACKWLGKLKDSKIEKQYHEYKSNITRFLTKNLTKILINPHLLWKIKIVIIYNLLR